MEDSHAKNALLTAALHARVEEFQSLIECNMLLREKILREANRLEESFRQKRDLTPGDLKLVSEGAAKYLQLRDELLALVDRYQCLLDYSEEELLRRGVDPRLRLVAIMVSVGTTQIAPVALVALVATAPSQPDNVTLISNTPPASGGPS